MKSCDIMRQHDAAAGLVGALFSPGFNVTTNDTFHLLPPGVKPLTVSFQNKCLDKTIVSPGLFLGIGTYSPGHMLAFAQRDSNLQGFPLKLLRDLA